MSDKEHDRYLIDIKDRLEGLALELRALRHRVTMLESGVRPSLVPPHPEPGKGRDTIRVTREPPQKRPVRGLSWLPWR